MEILSDVKKTLLSRKIAKSDFIFLQPIIKITDANFKFI